MVETDSPLIGKSIMELNIQGNTECMVIEVERDKESIIDLSSGFKLEEGDTLLLAGESEKLHSFEENMGILEVNG